jgi:thiol:disulfide interchange protein DsbD
MKKTPILLVLILAFSITTFAQIVTPVKWKFSSKKIANNQFELIFTANIDKGWHVYSQYLESDNGPVATSFTFEKNASYKLDGKTTESKSKKEYDANFEMNVNYFETKADFFQKVVLLQVAGHFLQAVRFLWLI